jgi:hypothetical protein
MRSMEAWIHLTTNLRNHYQSTIYYKFTFYLIICIFFVINLLQDNAIREETIFVRFYFDFPIHQIAAEEVSFSVSLDSKMAAPTCRL